MSRHKPLRKRQGPASARPVTRSDLLVQQADDKVRVGDRAAAAELYRQAVVLRPTHAVAFYNLGCCLQATGDLWGSAEAYRAAIALRPTADAHVNLAEVLRRRGDMHDALQHCEAGLSLGPRHAEGHVVRGMLLRAAGKADEAVTAFTTAIRCKPGHADGHLYLGETLAAQGLTIQAIAFLEQARTSRPDHVPTLLALSEARRVAGQTWEAFVVIRLASEIEPRNALVYVSMSAILGLTPATLEMAASAARLALDLAPTMWVAAFNLGQILLSMDKEEEAIAAFARAVEIDASKGEALFQLVKLHERSCDWEGLATARELARTMTYRRGRPVSSFGVMTLFASPQEHLLSARCFATEFTAQAGAPLSRYEPRNQPAERLRIGYLSADLRVHPVADLIAEVFELHDKGAFEVFAYSLGPNDQSAMRSRLIAAFDHFRDLRDLGDLDAAKRIFDDRIDILVDLSGYTQGSRSKILALRPAPVQVNFLGYPGTMGAPFMDYIIADQTVAPFDHQRFYDERIVQLPHCYQPNDRKRPVQRGEGQRSLYNLPETGFVFCCFNNTFKISSEVFDVWMRLLAAVPGSVLWLLKNNDKVEATLRREAEHRGVSGERLIFAPRVAKADHIARLSLADLFVDTLLYNAHTTASEALWVGLPVLTMIGDAFPARVGASLLRAVDLPDLVTETLVEYEAKALWLATNEEALAAVKSRLLRVRNTAPLFDAPLFTRHLEAAYREMAKRLREGEPPAAFAVDPT